MSYLFGLLFQALFTLWQGAMVYLYGLVYWFSSLAIPWLTWLVQGVSDIIWSVITYWATVLPTMLMYFWASIGLDPQTLLDIFEWFESAFEIAQFFVPAQQMFLVASTCFWVAVAVRVGRWIISSIPWPTANG